MRWIFFAVIAASSIAANVVFARGIKYSVHDDAEVKFHDNFSQFLVFRSASEEILRFDMKSRTIWANPKWKADVSATEVLKAIQVKFAQAPCEYIKVDTHVDDASSSYRKWLWRGENTNR